MEAWNTSVAVTRCVDISRKILTGAHEDASCCNDIYLPRLRPQHKGQLKAKAMGEAEVDAYLRGAAFKVEGVGI